MRKKLSNKDLLQIQESYNVLIDSCKNYIEDKELKIIEHAFQIANDEFRDILDSSNKNAEKTIGGKVYEYLRLNKPILALTPTGGESAKLIDETNSGIVVDPYDHLKIADTISNWIKAAPNKRIIKDYSSFERSSLAKQYRDFFEQVLSTSSK